MKTKIQQGMALLTAALLPLALPAADVQVTQPITNQVTWHRTNTYFLNGPIYVLSNAVLTIEAGTVIKGKPGGTNDASYLVICQGGKIYANGTPTQPIIFTAEEDDVNDPADLGIYDRGKWGGLVLLGHAPINMAADSAGNAANPKYEVYEGLSDIQINGQHVHRYGGNDPNDNSGVLRYVSIRHGGVKILPNKEINGLSLCGVGRGTVIEFVEAYAIADDGFEFFGGTVNTKYCVSAFCDDDAFDADMGYTGKNQFWLAIQERGAKDNGAELNGEINGAVTGNERPIGNYEIYNATWIGAGTNTAGNRGLQIRDYAAPRIYNSILTEFGGRGIRIDTTAATHLTNGLLDLRDNLWWNFATNGVPVPVAETAAAELLFTDTNRNNVVANPMLRGTARNNTVPGGLDPRPQAGSPALTSARTAPNDGFYTPVAYKGAFDANDLWIGGWTALSAYNFLPDKPLDVVTISGALTGNHFWARTNVYLLSGPVYVLSNATLTIEAGTVIKGRPGGTNDASYLVICQGGKIYANGSPSQPIIFTAEEDDVNDPADLGIYDRGKWGGLVLLGHAPINMAADSAGNAANPKYEVYEGLSDIQINGQHVHRYGGNDPNDNSGVLRYVSIRHGGVKILPNKEINGLSLCGVGRGTVIEFVEAYAIADDGFEFFGGTVNTKYCVSAFCDDDAFDADMGYTGKNQFWLAIQERGAKDNGAELNGEINGAVTGNERPIGNYEIYNATWIGAGTNTAGNRGLQIRDYAAPRIYNSILTEFGGRGIRIDTTAATHLTNGLLDLRDNLWWNFATNGVPVPVAETAAAELLFTDTNRNNVVADPLLRGISRTNQPAFGLDPRPQAGSPALTSARTAPNNGFYTPVAFKGAFGDINWASDWSALTRYGILSAAGGGTPPAVLPVVIPVAANLAAGKQNGNLLIGVSGSPNGRYQLQSVEQLGQPWVNVGEPLVLDPQGRGQFVVPMLGPGRFYRLQGIGQ
ncbi:hypothetical protein NXS98_17520 [Fontisphaera persica]|uniref:hypothetical protein n=1 Tax=Fontisphaera persica TaxID=2974023 RepID=UPI0024C0E294|nr:hypothetical protein [Fontisphaera persica]WCJ59491.1 hypothetical protein NXS98_17520 [Fontisphaera persica]